MKVVNRKAYHDYDILEKFEAGISLSGPEVKSAKEGKMSLSESFVKISDGQAWLINAHIHPYRFADTRDYDPTRPRKLLLKKKEIISLESRLKQRPGLTIIPLSCYTKGPWIKLEIALARGKKKYEKRAKIKERELAREIERALKR